MAEAAEAHEEQEEQSPAKQEAQPPKQPTRRNISPLPRSRLGQADQQRGRTLYALTEPGSTREDLLNPEYWKNVSASLQPGFRIEAYCETGEYLADLIVRRVGQNAAVVQVLNWYTLEEEGIDVADPDYEVNWGGGAKWRIVRKSDKAVIRQGMASRELAEREMRDFVKALAR